MKQLILVLTFACWPASTWAAEIEPVPVKEVITTGKRSFNVGETINPTFAVPLKALQSMAMEIDCDPTANYEVRYRRSTDGGKTWNTDGLLLFKWPGFTRKAGPCVDQNGQPLTKIGIPGTVRDASNNLVAFPTGTIIETRVITDNAMTDKELQVTFDKAP